MNDYCDWKYCVDNSKGVNFKNTIYAKCLDCNGEKTSCENYYKPDITEKLKK